MDVYQDCFTYNYRSVITMLLLHLIEHNIFLRVVKFITFAKGVSQAKKVFHLQFLNAFKCLHIALILLLVGLLILLIYY